MNELSDEKAKAMPVNYGTRWVWTSDEENYPNGAGKGTAYQMGNMPMDLRFIPPPESVITAPGDAVQAWHGWMRYEYDHTDDSWKIRPDAEPVSLHEDHWAWDRSPRYEVDPTDPLRNSWVLKLDALPVEQP